ncbi:hypothetical protein CYMTET_54000 [Cymbomonas tetramitiformis]|uniref:Uncharacterized protein n=1 Tax=Cymbomonas tetramitiformis TaxID=36881 RepID=A0AAE0BFY4_9CHLO|nr:hypothetical protein CYMTET_54000 [Cymbomonas tetramitiformis]
MPCITCFRLWGVTTGHMDTDGICVYSCTAAFVPGRAPPKAPPPPSAPPPLTAWPPSAAATPRAHSLQELEPPPQTDAPPQGASAMTVRFSAPTPALDGTDLPADDCSMDVGGGGGLQPVSALSIQELDDEVDWPALRDSPVWIPSISANDLASRNAPARDGK